MRAEQYAKLKVLQEKLIDVVLVEAEPGVWNGDPEKLAALSRDERGDRYWCKKNASATLSVLMKVISVCGMVERAASAEPALIGEAGETDLDREVKQAERDAKKILNRLQAGAKAGAKRDRAN